MSRKKKEVNRSRASGKLSAISMTMYDSNGKGFCPALLRKLAESYAASRKISKSQVEKDLLTHHLCGSSGGAGIAQHRGGSPRQGSGGITLFELGFFLSPDAMAVNNLVLLCL